MVIIIIQQLEEVLELDISVQLLKINYLLDTGHVNIYGQKVGVNNDVLQTDNVRDDQVRVKEDQVRDGQERGDQVRDY